jgi:hypothetical protein
MYDGEPELKRGHSAPFEFLFPVSARIFYLRPILLMS